MKISVTPITDIQEVYSAARATQGFPPTTSPLRLDKWDSWLYAEESQVRVYQLKIEMEDIPYWVHVHLIRHHIGIEWFVRTQRPDSYNPVVYQRGEASQSELISLTMICNPQAIINISRRRLCENASPETKAVWCAVKGAVLQHDDPYVKAIGRHMVADCEYRGNVCNSTKPCGLYGSVKI